MYDNNDNNEKEIIRALKRKVIELEEEIKNKDEVMRRYRWILGDGKEPFINRLEIK